MFTDNRDVFVIGEQGLHTAKAFFAFCTATLGRKLGVLGRLAEDRAGTGDPK